ncbi:hypothetical protein [Streptomyces sp. NPDC058701]|uniref:hypothetical protein n=1 Tax=Streptomyces sp. NPDC058701 TaxID=3346608 RepID=UPI00365DF6D1
MTRWTGVVSRRAAVVGRRPAVVAVWVALVLLAVPWVPATAGRAAAAEPATVSVENPRATVGRPLKATGTGWEPGSTVQVEVCGGSALRGSADCDAVRAAVALAAADGTFRVALIAGTPPSPCPCVLRASAQPTGARAQVALDLAGAGGVAPPAPVSPAVRVDVVSAALSGGPGLAELFGAPARRTLTVTLRNPGDRPLGRAPLIIAWGPGSAADIPVGVPVTAELPAGAQRTYRVPVELPAAAFGRYSVGGRYASAEFGVTTDIYPWGLLGAAAAAVLLTVYTAAVALRRLADRPRGRRASGAAALNLPSSVERDALLASLTGGPAGDGPDARVGTGALIRALAGEPALVDFRALPALLAAVRPAGVPAVARPLPAGADTPGAGNDKTSDGSEVQESA